jgi:hypothetical protein
MLGDGLRDRGSASEEEEEEERTEDAGEEERGERSVSRTWNGLR